MSVKLGSYWLKRNPHGKGASLREKINLNLRIKLRGLIPLDGIGVATKATLNPVFQ